MAGEEGVMEHGPTDGDDTTRCQWIMVIMEHNAGHGDGMEMAHGEDTSSGHEMDMGHVGAMEHGGGHGGGHGKDRFQGPASTIYYPLFDTFDRSTRQVVRMLTSSVSWESFFTASLPPDPNGITPVIENNFQIVGMNANYLGPEDYHETEYDNLVKTAALTNHGDSFTQIPFNPDRCQYSSRV